MTDKVTILDVARRDAQELHQKASVNIANMKSTTESDLKSVSDRAHKLSESLKSNAASQAANIKAYMHSAAESLDTAVAHARESAATGKDRLKQANLALQEGAHSAAQSISHAVALLRGQLDTAKAAKLELAS